MGIQTASLFGSYFVSFMIVVANGYIAYVISGIFGRSRRAWEVRVATLAVIAVLVIQYGVGGALYGYNKTLDGEKIKIAAVQANISSMDQWGGNNSSQARQIYREKTLKAAEEGAEVVVWAETALMSTLKKENDVYKFISSLAKEADVTIVAGVFTTDDEGALYNSVVCFEPDGQMNEAVYSKKHLVPFGEFSPLKELFENTLPMLVELVPLGTDLAEGTGAGVMELEKINVGGAVCYDAMYEDVSLDAAREGAQIICVASNDSWFGDSVYLRIHNSQIQLRAVECGRYVVHSANTGMSAIVSGNGEIVTELEPLTEGIAVGEVAARSNATLYSLIGNVLVLLCAVATAILEIFAVADLIYCFVKAKKIKKSIDITEKIW